RRTGAHAFTTRPFLPGFNGGLFLPERRSRGHTSEGGSAPVGFRPATAANARLCFEDLIPTDAASDLTCGDSLAGHPLKVLRQRRSNHPSGACTAREAGMDIRELLQRYQTAQPAMAPVEEEWQRRTQ
ncbi:unnamed protein product, partial [Durusdinium trenchii]